MAPTGRRPVRTVGKNGVHSTLRQIRHPFHRDSQLRAVLFDIDGTLYRQRPVQLRMALELAALPLRRPLAARSVLRAISGYRHAQEDLRSRHIGSRPLADAQIEIAARLSGLPNDAVATLVDEWMIRRPLKHLRKQLASGAIELLDRLEYAGVRVGVLSDYPAVEKLRALGLAGRFSPILCSSDPAINRFKPHPRGFLKAAETWMLPPEEILMIGDRYDVDYLGAQAAGMSCALVGRPSGVPQAEMRAVFSSLETLTRALRVGG